MAQGAHHLGNARGVCGGPQQIAALFDKGFRQGIKEPPCGEGTVDRGRGTRLALDIFHLKHHRHGQVRPGVF